VLIPAYELVKYWDVTPTGVLHVGAHDAEELEVYEQFNWGQIVWVEAQPDKSELLREKMKNTLHVVVEAAVWDEPNLELEMKVMSNSASSSLLNLGTHKEAHPDIKVSHTFKIKTKLLADVVSKTFKPDLLVLDIQGAELRALKGFGARLSGVKWIYSEVNKKLLYEECCLVDELDSYLSTFNFRRVATRWTYSGWGDALYINRDTISDNLGFRYLIWRIINQKYMTRNLLGMVKHRLMLSLKKF